MKTPQDLGHDLARPLAARSPRLAGALLFGLGLAAYGINIALLNWMQRFFAVAFVLGGAFITLGLWISITGRTNAGGVKQPRWWMTGVVVLGLAGLAGGVYVVAILKQ